MSVGWSFQSRTTRLYTPLCRSVRHTFTFSAFMGFLALLLLPKCSTDLKYGPCPPARDCGSRVSRLFQILWVVLPTIPRNWSKCKVAEKAVGVTLLISYQRLWMRSWKYGQPNVRVTKRSSSSCPSCRRFWVMIMKDERKKRRRDEGTDSWAKRSVFPWKPSACLS